MWLLNVDTRKLEYFEHVNIPRYAILSHRWRDGEITFQDVIRGEGQGKHGWEKVTSCCDQVSQLLNPTQYVWVDTCCIDKTNSAELSEAINSMFNWYAHAAVCLAFLDDVNDEDDFETSAWFTRGWTLQELLAPDKVYFYATDWKYLGEKVSLSYKISKSTAIPTEALSNFSPANFSIADKMSWAARRRTTRIEDIAYSLLGLFGVNMPLIYGEGLRAFRRLQEEILKMTASTTILAYQRFRSEYETFGILAFHPNNFCHFNVQFQGLYLHNILPYWSFRAKDFRISGSTISNFGIELDLPLVPYCRETYFVPLCKAISHESPASSSQIMGMLIRRSWINGVYNRIYHGDQCLFDFNSIFQVPSGQDIITKLDSYNPKDGLSPLNTEIRRVSFPLHSCWAQAPADLFRSSVYGFSIVDINIRGPDGGKMFCKTDIYSRAQAPDGSESKRWEYDLHADSCVDIIMRCGQSGPAGIVHLDLWWLSMVYLVIGYNFDFEPFCLAFSVPRNKLRHESVPSLLRFSRLPMNEVHLFSPKDLMSLLKAVRDSKQNINLEQDGVELFTPSQNVRDGSMCIIGKHFTIRLEDQLPFQQILIEAAPPRTETLGSGLEVEEMAHLDIPQEETISNWHKHTFPSFKT